MLSDLDYFAREVVTQFMRVGFENMTGVSALDELNKFKIGASRDSLAEEVGLVWQISAHGCCVGR